MLWCYSLYVTNKQENQNNYIMKVQLSFQYAMRWWKRHIQKYDTYREYTKINSGQWYFCYFSAWIWEDSFWMLVRFLLNLDSLIAYFFILVSTVDSLESVFSKFDSTRITLFVISLTRLSTWLFKLLMIESSSPLVSRPLAMYSSFWKQEHIFNIILVVI